MSSPQLLSYSPSSDFVSLCQSQVRLLQQGLQVDSCEVYITRSPQMAEEAEWVPVVSYAQSPKAFVSEAGFTRLPQQGNSNHFSELDWPISSLTDQEMRTGMLQPLRTQSSLAGLSTLQPLVLPLLYQETMVGVLVIGRDTALWQSQELQQLDQIAQTLAIACILDQRQVWYEQQLQQQQSRQQWERDHWDDLLHQLRNPLTALRTFGKLLLKRLGSDPKSQTVVEGIVREGEHLQELLQSFESQVQQVIPLEIDPSSELEVWPEKPSSAVSPLLLPSANLSCSPLLLQPILNNVLLAETAIAQERQIRLNIDLVEDLPPILGNAQALREVLSNLIDNALKYTPSLGEVTVRLGIEHPTAPQQWQGLEIADSGYGIPKEDQDHIFERHYRGVQAQGEIPGTGLGLAIAQELVTSMQGELRLISPNPNSHDPRYPGTIFQLWLRIARI
ncbi:MAG: ATP-binding protein [Snowella sp.]|nr:ATP-binding protein [Snowella sp.]